MCFSNLYGMSMSLIVNTKRKFFIIFSEEFLKICSYRYAYMGVFIQGIAFAQRNTVCIESEARGKYQVTEKCKTCIKSTVKHI